MNDGMAQPHQPFVSIPQHATKVLTFRLKLNDYNLKSNYLSGNFTWFVGTPQ